MALVHELIHGSNIHAPLRQLLLPLLLINQAFEEIIFRKIGHQFFALANIFQGLIIGLHLSIGSGPVKIAQYLIEFARFHQGQGLRIILDSQFIILSLFIDRAAVEVQRRLLRRQGNRLVTVSQGFVRAAHHQINEAATCIKIGIVSVGFNLPVHDV